jgi:hypothetical protein
MRHNNNGISKEELKVDATSKTKGEELGVGVSSERLPKETKRGIM